MANARKCATGGLSGDGMGVVTEKCSAGNKLAEQKESVSLSQNKPRRVLLSVNEPLLKVVILKKTAVAQTSCQTRHLKGRRENFACTSAHAVPKSDLVTQTHLSQNKATLAHGSASLLS